MSKEEMSSENRRLLALILITILTGLTGLVGNIASNQLPQSWQLYLWLTWPLFALFLLLTIIALRWQTRLEAEPPLDPPPPLLVPPDELSQFDVFISYSHSDEEVVTKLVNRLRADGFTLWIDEEQVGGGDQLRQVMVDGIKQSRHLMCCLSADYLTSDWGTFESAVNQALDPANRDHRLIPVRIAPVDIPPEYKWLYCPDLTNRQTWEREYQKAIKPLQAGKKEGMLEENQPAGDNDNGNGENTVDDNKNSGEPASDTRLQTPRDETVVFTPPSQRLRALGFQFDPFAYPEAERMPATMVEDTFVAHPGFDKDVMDLNRSTVLLAQPGGGKTAGLRRLETFLLDRRERSFKSTLEDNLSPHRPMVVTYNVFGKLIDRLPNIGLQDHTGPLLTAVAEATWEFIDIYPERFLSLDNRMQKWWRDFLITYLYGQPPIHQLRDNHLRDAWDNIIVNAQRMDSETQLEYMLKRLLHIRGPLSALGLDSLFILVDGIDGYTKRSLNDLSTLVNPLLTPSPLSQQPRVVWKFFLPDILKETVQLSSGLDTGRFNMVPIQWDEDSLIRFLQTRLKWASKNLIEEFAQLCESGLIRTVKIEEELAKMAHRYRLGPPRTLLTLARYLLHWSDPHVDGHLVTIQEWNAFQSRIQEKLEQDKEVLNADKEQFIEFLRNRYQSLEQRVELSRRIEDAFNLVELHELCARLGIRYDNLEGGTLRRKTQELVEHLYRRGQLTDLVLLLHKELRPLIKWF